MRNLGGWSSVPNWVIRTDKLKGNEKWVYIALLNRANSNGVCYPSLRLLAEDVDVSKPTVIKALKSLEDKGLIERQKRRLKGAEYASNEYFIQPWEPSKESLPGSKNEYPGVVKPVYKGSKKEDHEVLPIEVLPNRSNTQLSARDLESLFDEAYSAWPKKVERKKSFEKFKQVCRKRDPDELVADIRKFADAYERAGTEKRFVPALVVWLNGERWTDELPTQRPGEIAVQTQSRVQQGMSVADELRAMEGRYAG